MPPPARAAQLPTIVASAKSRREQDATRKTFGEMIGDINRRLRYRNRGVGDRSRRYNKGPSMGIGKSDYAAELQNALERTGVRMTGHELGEPFQISIGAAGNNIDTSDSEARHLPELVLTRGQLSRALSDLRRLSRVEGDDEYMDPADTFDTTDTGQRVRTGGGNPLFRQLGPIAEKTRGNPKEHAVVERAYEIINKLPEPTTMAPFVAMGAKPIRKFASKLELIMPKPKEADPELEGGLPGESPQQQLRKAGLGVPTAPGTAMFEEPDPLLDEKALVLVCQLVANSGEEYPFIKIEGQGPVTPDTIVSFVDPRAVGVADFHKKHNPTGVEDEELRNLGAPSAARTTPFGKEASSQDAAQRSLEFMKQRRAEREARRRGETPPQMSTESTQWMDIYNLMEHWGF